MGQASQGRELFSVASDAARRHVRLLVPTQHGGRGPHVAHRREAVLERSQGFVWSGDGHGAHTSTGPVS